MARSSSGEQGTRTSISQHPRTSAMSASLSSASYTSNMSGYASRSRSDTLHSGDSMWNGTFSSDYPGSDDAHFESMTMDPMSLADSTYMMPVMSSGSCYNAPAYDQFSQGPMSQTLTGPLLEPSYPDAMLGDELMQASPVSMDFPNYGHSSQHTWRHGQLSPPAEIFNADLNEFTVDPVCDMSFQGLPESAVSGAFTYDKIAARSVCNAMSFLCSADALCSASRPGQPRPIRSASERSNLSQATMAPQDIQYTRNDRADKVKARNDPRYDIGPDKDGYYHCPMVSDGSCNHKPTKQKCIYAYVTPLLRLFLRQTDPSSSKYLDSHLKPYVCTHGEKGSECDGARFSSNACLFRHEREAHGMHNHGLNPYLCLFHGCERSRQGNGFPRRWNQRDHMKRVHDWEEPETSGYDTQDRTGASEPNKRRKGSGASHSVQMKRTSSSQAKAQAATYFHGSRHSVSMSRSAAQVEKLEANILAYPVQYNDVQFSQVPAYQQQPRTSEGYPGNYLVAY